MIEPEQMLILEPASEIHFVGPFTDIVTSTLSLTNTIDQTVCFKVKTTAPKSCCVRPNNGILEPKQKAVLSISLQPNYNPNEGVKLKFMIQAMIVSEKIVNMETLFEKAKPENIINLKLSCVFDTPDKMMHNVLIIGSGGREHALAWKLSESPRIKQIFVAPGNAGTLLDPSGKITNVAMNVKHNEEIVEWCSVLKVDLVIGDKVSLSNGIAECLNKQKVKCFGPCRRAARIENEEFFKFFTDCYNIPIAESKTFTCAKDAEEHILSASYNAFVVKTSCLGSEKRAIEALSKEDAVKAVYFLKEDKDLVSYFVPANETFVVEELLDGEKISVMCFSDGTNISVMPPAQHFKGLFDSNGSLMAGDMENYRKGFLSEDTLKLIKNNILKKTVDGMMFGGDPYIGALYASLVITKDGPRVIEFKCRFGDLETQVILPLINSDLYEVMLACVNGTLDKVAIQWSTKFAVGVEVVSREYPDDNFDGKVITGLDKVSCDCIVFHAGTAMNDNNIVTSGKRVFTVVALEGVPLNAVFIVKKCASDVHFDGAQCCNGIGSLPFCVL